MKKYTYKYHLRRFSLGKLCEFHSRYSRFSPRDDSLVFVLVGAKHVRSTGFQVVVTGSGVVNVQQ